MAILKRRHPKKTHHKILDAIWPRMGWRRALRYVKHRLVRLQDSDRNIAVGLSWGAAVSFSPLIGTHILQGLLFTWLTRGNLAASVVGTLWGNPWTGPAMQWFSYETGKVLFRVLGFSDFASLPEGLTFSGFFDYVFEHPLDLILPWVVGGSAAGLMVWPFFYLFHYWMIRSARAAHHTAREAARHHRTHRRALAAQAATTKEKTGEVHHAHHRHRQ